MIVWIDGQPAGIRIEAHRIDVPPMLIRLSAIEDRPFELPLLAEHTRSDDTKRNVRGVLPVMSQWSGRDIHRRRTMHECNGTKGGLACRRGVQFHPQRSTKSSLIHHRQLHEKIMRMLMVVERLSSL